MPWYKIVFLDDSDRAAFRQQLRLMLRKVPHMAMSLTIYRQISLNPPTVTYFLPDLSAYQRKLLDSCGLEVSEAPDPDLIELFFGDEGDSDRFLRREPGKS